MRVLVIEDAPEVAHLLEMVLILRDHVKEVTLRIDHFDKTIEETDWDKIDLVITDRHLEEFDGCKILGDLKQLHPHIGRIMLTGDISVVADTCAAQAILPKPISLERLTAAILKVTSNA